MTKFFVSIRGRGGILASLAVLLSSSALLLTSCDSAGIADQSAEATYNQAERGFPANIQLSGHALKNLPEFHPSTEKYSDAGLKPATGRAGSATLTVRALLGKDGLTLLEATTGALDAAEAPPGNIDKAQIKLLNPDDPTEALWTQNYNKLRDGGRFEFGYTEIARGMPLQAQVNVSGIDKRTGVVTVVEHVKLRPDLTVTDLAAPARARVNLTVPITASVAELNGDIGATTQCVLYANGEEIDRIAAVWVDVDRPVSCAFLPTFTEPGTYALRTVLEDVVPGDWDTANNEATATIEITLGNDFYYTASAYADVARWTDSGRTRRDFHDPVTTSWSEDWREHGWNRSGQEQWAQYSGYMHTQVAFPLNLTVSQESGGSVLHAGTFEGIVEAYTDTDTGLSCGLATSADAQGRAEVIVCTTPSDQSTPAGSMLTDVFYRRDAGYATYFSFDYVRYHRYYYTWGWSGSTYRYQATHSYWSNNRTEGDPSEPLPAWGSDLTIELDLEATGSSYVYHGEAVVPLTAQDVDISEPWGVCGSGHNFTDYCQREYHRRGVAGSTTGVPN